MALTRKEIDARYKENHPHRRCEISKKYRKLHPEKIAEYNKKYKQEKPEFVAELKKKWTRKNIVSVNAQRRKRLLEKFSCEPEYEKRYRLKLKMSNSINKALKGSKNGASWELLVGYTLNDLIYHLEKQFVDGMTWENRGKGGWHIDHIIPISVFNIMIPQDEDFKKCWALKNLRPLWEKENLDKKAKLEAPFQPSLAMG